MDFPNSARIHPDESTYVKTDWDDLLPNLDDATDTDSHYSSQESIICSDVNEYSASDDSDDSENSKNLNNFSSTSDTYDSSDSELSNSEEFFESCSCVENDHQCSANDTNVTIHFCQICISSETNFDSSQKNLCSPNHSENSSASVDNRTSQLEQSHRLTDVDNSYGTRLLKSENSATLVDEISQMQSCGLIYVDDSNETGLLDSEKSAKLLDEMNQMQSHGLTYIDYSYNKELGLFRSRHGKQNNVIKGYYDIVDANIVGDSGTSTEITTNSSQLGSNSKPNIGQIDEEFDEPENYLRENKCQLKLDILLQLKDILNKLTNDYKQSATKACEEVQQEMKDIIARNETFLKEHELSEKRNADLEHIEGANITSKAREKKSQRFGTLELFSKTAVKMENLNEGSQPMAERASTSKDKIKGHPFTDDGQQNISTINNFFSDEADSSDSADSVDYHKMAIEYKIHFNAYRVKLEKLMPVKKNDWKKNFSSNLRQYWAETLALAAQAQVEPKPGRDFDKDGFIKFAESIEWEVFNHKAKNASELDYLKFLAFK